MARPKNKEVVKSKEVVNNKKEDRKTKQSLQKHREKQQWAIERNELVKFEKQLELLGLVLKDVKGDGNCLFRALGDQFNGDGENHFEYRQNTIKYIKDHREDFEPFLEEDTGFDEYVKLLGQSGTYAGHWALIAFSRHYNVHITIHQLDQPQWKIMAEFNHTNRTLHIAYFGYEHYSSIRNIGESLNGPANIVIKAKKVEGDENSSGSKSKPQSSKQGMNWFEQQIMTSTGCTDIYLVRRLLEENDSNADIVTEILLAQKGGDEQPIESWESDMPTAEFEDELTRIQELAFTLELEERITTKDDSFQNDSTSISNSTSTSTATQTLDQVQDSTSKDQDQDQDQNSNSTPNANTTTISDSNSTQNLSNSHSNPNPNPNTKVNSNSNQGQNGKQKKPIVQEKHMSSKQRKDAAKKAKKDNRAKTQKEAAEKNRQQTSSNQPSGSGQNEIFI